MANFEKQVFDSTAETDPRKALRAQEEYARNAAMVQKQFGGQQAAGTPNIGVGTSGGAQDVQAQTQQDEFDRRKQATKSAFDLGSQVDERRSKLADELNAALRKRNLVQQKASDTQDQNNRSFALDVEQIGEDARQKMQTQNFTLYKNSQDRKEALRSAIDKGDAEAQMAKAAASGALKQQDLDNYFDMIEADLRADYEAAIKGSEMDWETYKLNLASKSSGIAQIASGATGAVGAYVAKKITQPGASA